MSRSGPFYADWGKFFAREELRGIRRLLPKLFKTGGRCKETPGRIRTRPCAQVSGCVRRFAGKKRVRFGLFFMRFSP